MGHFIKFTFSAFDKDFSVHVDDKDISTPVKMLNEKSRALAKANREFLDKFLDDGIDPFPGWWAESSPTDFYWNVGNNSD
ncbi:MAG: hypothetical protein HOK61_12305 [Alphaproteobacteria bacterium]|mgnify:FL=1|jgi:hypothetical protein|nr:hypothetical protein [Alphaproteobacteria bacterium]